MNIFIRSVIENIYIKKYLKGLRGKEIYEISEDHWKISRQKVAM